MRDFKRDAVKAGVAIGAGLLLAFLLNYGTPFGLGFLAGRTLQHPRVVALTDTIRLTDSIVVTRTDTVVKYQRRVDTVKARSDALDSAVGIVDSVSVRVADTVAIIPPEVVSNLSALRLTVATQDTLIRSLYGRDSTQEWRIATRDKMIRELSKRHPFACGRKCGFTLGVLSSIAVYKAVK